MSGRKLLLALAGIVSLVVGYFLLPGPEERIAMLLRDGRHEKALVQLERLLQQGRGNPNLIATFGRLHEEAGTHRHGTQILEAYLTKQPSDADALRSLVSLYDGGGDTEGQVRALSRLVAVDPTRSRLSRILGLYRLHGDFDAERELLARMWNSPLLEISELERLGALLAGKGDLPTALRVLRRVDTIAPLTEERPRLLLFEVLLASGLGYEADQRAMVWLKSWKKPWLAVQLVKRLAANSKLPHLDLATTAVTLHPDIRFFLVKELAEASLRPIAASLLAEWPTSSTEPTADELAGFMAAADAIGDAALIWRKFAQIRSRSQWLKAQAIFAEVLADRFGLAAVAALRPRLSPATLARRPLFAAQLAIYEGDLRLARKQLHSVDLVKLSAGEKQAWLRLVTSLDGDYGALRLLAHLRHAQQLPSGLRSAHLTLAQKLQQTPEYLLGISDLARVASHVNGRQSP